jgi:molybdopterin synthase sulfur carrier subunit
MRVKIFATLRQFVGAKEVDVDVETGDTVRQVLERLTAKYPALGERILDEGGNVRSSVNVLVNGRSVTFLEGLNTVTQEGDVIALFPSVGGG